MKRATKAVIAILAVTAAAWIVLVFLEGDACADAGGRFQSLLMQCYVAPGQSYTPLVNRSHWPFWAFYGAATIFVAAVIFALLFGLASGLRSLWRGVVSARGA